MEYQQPQGTRSVAVNTLAVIGFITLVFIGIMLAIGAARLVPDTLSRIGSFFGFAAAGEANGGLVVIPESPIVDEDVFETPTRPATTTPEKPEDAPNVPTTPRTPDPVIGYRTITTDYPVPGSIRVPKDTQDYFGSANLVAEITDVGYLDKDGDFVRDSSLTRSDRLAVKFVVRNTGTNVSGKWKLEATLPTRTDKTYDYTSKTQDSIAPGAKTEFVISLARNDLRSGDNQAIVIKADADNDVRESNERDNEDSADVDVAK